MADVFVQGWTFGEHHVAGQDTHGKGVEGGADARVPLIALRGRESGVGLGEKGAASKMTSELRQQRQDVATQDDGGEVPRVGLVEEGVRAECGGRGW